MIVVRPPKDFPHLTRYLSVFEFIQSVDLSELDDIVTPDMRFTDPFNDLKGVGQLKRLLTETKQTVDQPRFDIVEIWAETGNRASIVKWRFSGRMPVIGPVNVTGLSEITLAKDGRIAAHVDYWDTARPIFMKLPLIGFILRRIARRLALS